MSVRKLSGACDSLLAAKVQLEQVAQLLALLQEEEGLHWTLEQLESAAASVEVVSPDPAIVFLHRLLHDFNDSTPLANLPSTQLGMLLSRFVVAVQRQRTHFERAEEHHLETLNTQLHEASLPSLPELIKAYLRLYRKSAVVSLAHLPLDLLHGQPLGCETTKLLDLRHCALQDVHMTRLSQQLARLPRLEVLLFQENALSEQSVEVLLPLLNATDNDSFYSIVFIGGLPDIDGRVKSAVQQRIWRRQQHLQNFHRSVKAPTLLILEGIGMSAACAARRLREAPCDFFGRFSCVAASSLATVVAVCVACRISMDQCCKALEQLASAVFGPWGMGASYALRVGRGVRAWWSGDYYSSASMRAVVASLLGPTLSTLTLENVEKRYGVRLLLVARSVANGCETVLCQSTVLLDAIVACSAIPSLFAAVSIGETDFCDSMSSPALLAAVTAMDRMTPPTDLSVEVLSCTSYPSTRAGTGVSGLWTAVLANPSLYSASPSKSSTANFDRSGVVDDHYRPLPQMRWELLASYDTLAQVGWRYLKTYAAQKAGVSVEVDEWDAVVIRGATNDVPWETLQTQGDGEHY